MGSVTDTKRPLKSDPGHPEACNVCQLHKLVGIDYEELWQNERADRLLPIISETMREVKEKVGLA
jgi:hypothetical protein